MAEYNKFLNKPKSVGISAILGDERLSKIVSEGLKAPLGSSKREKAAAALKSINKISSRNSLMGGKGGMPDTPYGLVSPYEQKSSDRDMASRSATTKQEEFAKMWGLDPATGRPQSGNVQQEEGTQQGENFQFSNQPVSSYQSPTQSAVSSQKTLIKSAPKITPQTGTQAPGVKEEEIPETGYDISREKYDLEIPTIEDWYTNLSEEQQERWRPLYEAKLAEVGPKTTAYDVMSDVEKLSTLFPNIPKEQLPVGASLTRQVDDIKDRLEEEYQIDQLRNNLATLQNRGLTIEDDLEGYMTARDKYIEKLDDMIYSAKDKMAEMDLSNPATRKMSKNYMNYLYLLKGRQQKRYADYLDDAIDYHDKELQRAESTYNNAKDLMQEELQTETAITEEDYNRLFTTIEEMYDALDTIEESQMEKLGNEIALKQTILEYNNDLLSGIFIDAGPKDIRETRKYLKRFLDKNDYIPLEKWLEKKRKWDAKFGSGVFEENFPATEYLNPNIEENARYLFTPYQQTTNGNMSEEWIKRTSGIKEEGEENKEEGILPEE